MPKPKPRKNVDENFKLAAVQRLQTGGVSANELAKELDVSIWSLRKWSRKYRKKIAAGAGAVGEPVTPAVQAGELPAGPGTEPVAPQRLIKIGGERSHRAASADNLVAGKKLGDLLHRSLRRIRAVNRVFAD